MDIKAKKETVKIVIIGHVDHGKSTLIGRLLLETNSLPKGKIEEIKKISRTLGKDTELAYLADQLREERVRSATIDTTQIFFKTRKKKFVIIDTPGHVEFLKNMITGASLAQAAVLVVDANEGVMEQTRRHAFIASMLGIDKIVIAFNKMDIVGYEEKIFDKVKNELSIFLEDLDVRPLFMVPVSAREGVNISRRSQKTIWYKGPSLTEALESLKSDREAVKKPLRFPVQDIYEIGREKIIVGKVASGVIKKRQGVIFLPSFKGAKIKDIRIFKKYGKRKASSGENIGLVLDRSFPVKRGEVIIQADDPRKSVNSFKGNIFWMSEEPLRVNKTITLRCATQEVECIAEKIEKRINTSTFDLIEKDAIELKLNEAGVVVFRTEKPVVIEKFSFIEELGRFVIERGYDLQGAGVIL